MQNNYENFMMKIKLQRNFCYEFRYCLVKVRVFQVSLLKLIYVFEAFAASCNHNHMSEANLSKRRPIGKKKEILSLFLN